MDKFKKEIYENCYLTNIDEIIIMKLEQCKYVLFFVQGYFIMRIVMCFCVVIGCSWSFLRMLRRVRRKRSCSRRILSVWFIFGRVVWFLIWVGLFLFLGVILFNMIMIFIVKKYDIEIICIISYISLFLLKSYVSSYFFCFIFLFFIL